MKVLSPVKRWTFARNPYAGCRRQLVMRQQVNFSGQNKCSNLPAKSALGSTISGVKAESDREIQPPSQKSFWSL
jgi:hypothetical protein